MSIDYIRTCGITQVNDGIVLPLATGMSLSLCLLSLRQERPGAKYVVWFRVDQKTCLKSILTSGLTPFILPPRMEGDELITDMEGLTTLLSSTPASEILCILPTTSVFAPRLPDDIVAISRIAKRYDIPVIVNNAYGLQSRSICSSIDRAIRSGCIDLIVSSTDKNLLVPVGGAFVYGPRGDRIELIRKNYPGRASMSPILDVFITLLHFGKEGILELLSRREECVDYMREQLGSLAQKYGQRLLDVKHNPISMAVTLDSPYPDDPTFEYTDKDITRFGAMLYTRGVSGARCVGHHTSKKVGPYEFANYGSHNDTYPHAYFTAAAAIGISREDVDSFMERLDKNWKQYLKELAKRDS